MKDRKFIEEKYLSALTDREIFERVKKNSGIAEKDKEILGYLSMKKEDIENRVFGKNEKAWDWKFDYIRDEFKLPEKGKDFLCFLKSFSLSFKGKPNHEMEKDLGFITDIGLFCQ